MYKILWFLIPIGMFVCFSCEKKNSEDEKPPTLISDSEFEKKQIDQERIFTKAVAKMENKKIFFHRLGNCSDTIKDPYKQSKEIIKFEKISDNSYESEIYFKSACCQNFEGDYVVKNDTLIFEYKKATPNFCYCLCWYHYKLKIDEIPNKFTAVKFIRKM
jgi:hypothetical protein